MHKMVLMMIGVLIGVTLTSSRVVAEDKDKIDPNLNEENN